MFETVKSTIATAWRAYDESKKFARGGRIRRQWEAHGQNYDL